MFTGLVREVMDVISFENNELKIKNNLSDTLSDAKIGDSIAINGACLTIINIKDNIFTFEISEESKSHIALENYQGKVHIEPALRLNDRVDGHLVQGHIDAIGVIEKIVPNKVGTDIYIKLENKMQKYMIEKGSIAIDGISLTINEVNENIIRLTIIPHTFKNTIFKEYKIGTRVNIESDMIIRSLHHLMKFEKQENSEIWQKISHIEAYY